MSFFLVLLGTIIVVEVFFRLRIKYNRCWIEIVRTTKESTKSIRSKTIPDIEKEKLLLRNSAKLFVNSLVLLGLVLLTVSSLVVIVTVNSLNGGNVLQFLLTPIGVVLSTLSAAIYVVVRVRLFSG